MFAPSTLILVDQIKPAKHNRKLNSKKTQDIAESVTSFGGLFQAIGVIADEDGYRLVWGNHRLAAYRMLGREEIEARILAPDTTPDQELAYSIQENSLRTEESLEDILARVEQYAAYKSCSIDDAAKQNGVSPSYVSKGRSTLKKLHAKVKKLAKDHKVGISVLYSIAQAPQEEKQLKLITAYINGTVNRDGIVKAVSKKTGGKKRQSKKTSLSKTFDGIKFTLVIPMGKTPGDIKSAISGLSSELNVQFKRNIPVHLLPQVMV